MAVSELLSTTEAAGLTLILGLYIVWAIRVRASSDEPKILPYWIPWVGHTLQFASGNNKVFQAVADFTPTQEPMTIILAGSPIYVINNEKDVRAVYRHSRSLAFEPLVEWGFSRIFGATENATKCLRTNLNPDGMPEDLLLYNAHAFFGEALREGPQLQALTRGFLRELAKGLALLNKEIEQDGIKEVYLQDWTRSLQGVAATTAMMGPTLLDKNPRLLDILWEFEADFVKFVFGLPRWLIPGAYKRRNKLLDAFISYFKEDKAKRVQAIPMVETRAVQMRQSGMNAIDVAAGTFSYWWAVHANSNPMTFWMLLNIIQRPDLITRLREELKPVFGNHDELDVSNPVKDIDQLVNKSPLMRSIYYEVLRLATGTVSNRMVVEDAVIAGKVLKTGATIMMPVRPQHMSSQIWGEDVNEFNPDRFLGESQSKEKFVRPFGGGTSLCPGRFFASYEILSAVASLIWMYDIKLAEGERVPDYNLRAPNVGVMSPTWDVKVIIKKRV